MSAQQDSRKILEDINFKKQQMQKGLATITSQPPVQSQPYEPPVNSLARATLTQAQSSSFGYFIPQDSQFGNTILPVLPRFD